MASRRWSLLTAPLLTAALALAACSSQPASPTSSKLYVDPATGLDTNPGTKAEPLKTIAEALKDYAAGETIVLDAGTYNEISGEAWPYTLPAGVVIQANTSGVVLASNAGANGFNASADATFKGVTMTGFQNAVAASGGTLTLSNTTLDSNFKSLVLSGTAKADLSTTDFKGSGAGADLTASSSLTMTGGSVTGLTNTAFYADGSATVNLSQVQVTNTTYEALELRQTATAVLTACTIDNASPQGGGSGASLVPSDNSTLTLKNTNVGNAASYGILTYGSAAVNIQGGDIYGNGTAGINASGPLTIDGATVSYNGADGIEATGATTITNAVIDNNAQDGIYYDGTNTLKVRGTELKSNKIAVQLAGPGGMADLGTYSDQGNNVLQSTVTGSTGVYADTWTTTSIRASGNTWNPNVEGASATGIYLIGGSFTGPDSGGNITLGSGVVLLV